MTQVLRCASCTARAGTLAKDAVTVTRGEAVCQQHRLEILYKQDDVLEQILNDPSDDIVERLAEAIEPFMFDGRPDEQVGAAARWDRNDARKRVRAMLAELKKISEES